MAPSLLERAGGEAGIIMKTYTKPETTAVELQQSNCLLQASVRSISGDADLNFAGGGNVDARTREVFSEEEW